MSIVQVTFVAEGAVDAGGPRREFFRLLARQASHSSYFCGNTFEKFFACNVPAVRVRCFQLFMAFVAIYVLCALIQKNEYFILGQYAAMSAVQGGPSLPFFSPEVYNYLSTEEITNIKLSSNGIPDPEVRQLVSEVCMV